MLEPGAKVESLNYRNFIGDSEAIFITDEDCLDPHVSLPQGYGYVNVSGEVKLLEKWMLEGNDIKNFFRMLNPHWYPADIDRDRTEAYLARVLSTLPEVEKKAASLGAMQFFDEDVELIFHDCVEEDRQYQDFIKDCTFQFVTEPTKTWALRHGNALDCCLAKARKFLNWQWKIEIDNERVYMRVTFMQDMSRVATNQTAFVNHRDEKIHVGPDILLLLRGDWRRVAGTHVHELIHTYRDQEHFDDEISSAFFEYKALLMEELAPSIVTRLDGEVKILYEEIWQRKRTPCTYSPIVPFLIDKGKRIRDKAVLRALCDLTTAHGMYFYFIEGPAVLAQITYYQQVYDLAPKDIVARGFISESYARFIPWEDQVIISAWDNETRVKQYKKFLTHSKEHVKKTFS